MRFSAGLATLLSCLVLVGCTTSIRMPDSDEVSEIYADRKALVMMRIEARFENEPVESFSVNSENFFIMKSADYEGDRKLKNLWPYRSPSEDALREGWIYILLNPGSHYLYIKPPPFSRELDRIRSYEPYWLTIPKGEQLVYAGSFIAACKSRKQFFSRNVEDCSGLQILDERDKARAASVRYFPGLGTAAVSLAKKYPPLDSLLKIPPPEIVFQEGRRLDSPDWQKRGISKATGIGGTDDSEEVTRTAGLGAGGDPRGYAGLVMLYILYLPIGITTGAVTGSLNESRWSACIQDLDAGIHAMNMEELFRNEFASAGSATEGSDSRPRGRLELTIQRLVIRECSRSNTFCPEVSVRATYRDNAGSDPLYETVYAYADSHIELETPAYQIRQSKGEACRELGDYCSDNGKRAFYDDIRRGLEWISARVRQDLGLSPDDRSRP